MPSKCLCFSISTVNFKRLLVSSTAPYSSHRLPLSNTHIERDPYRKINPLSPSSRLIASIQVSEQTHFVNSHLSHDFYSQALKISGKLGFLPEGKQLHSQVVKLGYYKIQSLLNQLLNFYVKCGEFCDGQSLFDEMPMRNVVSWNAMICGLADSGGKFRWRMQMVFCYFKRMMLEMVSPDHVTFTGLLRASIELYMIEIGRQLHCLIMKWGYCSDCYVGGALVDLYGKLGFVEDARRVFESIAPRDLVSWNVMISCYALNRLAEEAAKIFGLMRSESVNGDHFTFSSLLSSCGTLRSYDFGKQVHGLVIRLAYDLDLLVASALVDMYAKSDYIDDAHRAFDGMAIRNVVSWTTIIVGYGRHGNGKDAIKLLKEMLREDFCPDELTLASTLSSCANISSCCEVTQVHSHATKKGFQAFCSIVNALINAYSKCGSIDSAFMCFNSTADPDLVTWTSMIGAYAFHGLSREAIGMFEKMLSNSVKPDGIVFLQVLSACSHGGMVNEGLHYFSAMTNYYRIMPDSEHYTCLVDLLGRAGLLNEALNVVTSIPSEPTSNALGAFISACKLQRNVRLAKWAGEKLFLLEPNKPVNYSLMSNVYASIGSWLDVARVRKMMKDRCEHKTPGCSWMEVAGEVSAFVSSDNSTHEAPEVYAMLETLVGSMKDEDCP
ncbi:E motif [Dillenia turbinata]|uniref:E motif n=1 Tax=Dillenia turbinata TaxID=194707 RepID=A0AAN8Z1R9_9MAGN